MKIVISKDELLARILEIGIEAILPQGVQIRPNDLVIGEVDLATGNGSGNLTIDYVSREEAATEPERCSEPGCTDDDNGSGYCDNHDLEFSGRQK